VEWFVYPVLFISALAIAYEDIKFRSVRLWWFVLLLLSVVVLQLQRNSWSELIYNFGINLTFVTLQLGILQLYYYLKEQSFPKIFDHYLGWGDVVLWVCVLPVWPLVGFMSFMIVSLTFSLLVYVIFIRRWRKTVPLAGLQAVFFLFVYVAEKKGLIYLSMWAHALISFN